MSTARITTSHVFADALFEIGDFVGSRAALGKERLMNLVGRESPSAADNDLVVLFIPFEDGAWSEPKSTSNLRRDGDLSLGCESRFGELHKSIVLR